jgi:2-haloacid dehalogenase
VFDAYGTLVRRACAGRQGGGADRPKADALSRLWRQKQLEYTWLRSLMRAHADFWQVTGEALDYALAPTASTSPGSRTSSWTSI